jgi:LPS sulfotransferase NodH
LSVRVRGGTRKDTADRDRDHPVLFMVFGNQRTGSTLVANRLNSHSNVICFEEIFLPWVDSEPSLRGWLDSNGRHQWERGIPGVRTSFLNSLLNAKSIPAHTGAVGFKVMYNQMSLWPKFAYLAPDLGQLLQDFSLRRWLRSRQVTIIHTLRRNRLKVLVSHELAVQTGRFHSRDLAEGPNSVLVPLRGLHARLRRIEAAERVARDTIQGLPTIEVFYEDYVGSQGREQDARLCSALGQAVPEDGLSSPLSKVSGDDLRETIRNYDEVAAKLSGTRFEHFLYP